MAAKVLPGLFDLLWKGRRELGIEFIALAKLSEEDTIHLASTCASATHPDPLLDLEALFFPHRPRIEIASSVQLEYHGRLLYNPLPSQLPRDVSRCWHRLKEAVGKSTEAMKKRGFQVQLVIAVSAAVPDGRKFYLHASSSQLHAAVQGVNSWNTHWLKDLSGITIHPEAESIKWYHDGGCPVWIGCGVSKQQHQQH